MPPLLTIGLPVYNAAPFLEDALRSILAQTFGDWELVAVDDGSADNSSRILQQLKDARVHSLVDGQHRGLGARLNQIVGLAKGKYIARMDADDQMHPERLSRQVAFLEQHPEIDVVGCGLISFDRKERPMSVRRVASGHADIVKDPLSGVGLAHATVVGRADWWRKRPYNEANRGCEDWELWLGSYAESRFANLPELLYFYREEQAYSLRSYIRDKLELASLLRRQSSKFGLAAYVASAAQWARVAVYAAFGCIRADRMLVRLRGSSPAAEEVRWFEEALARIRTVQL